MHVDGGGQRCTKSGIVPAAWAVVVTIEAADGTRAFDRYICGEVITEKEHGMYIGAEAATSTTNGICAQVYAAALLLSNEAGFR